MSIEKLTIHYAQAWLMGIDPIATGKQLGSIRRAHNLTQEKLSELFEKGGETASRNAISTWETGKKCPSLVHVVFLAELYHCSLDELVLSYRRSRGADDRDQPVPLLGIILIQDECMQPHMFAFFLCNPLVVRPLETDML